MGEGATQPGAALYVSVGGLTNLAIGTAGVCHFTRVTTGGLDAMITDLAERRALTREHAEQWLEHVGLTSPVDAIEGDPEIVGEARNVLSAGVDRIAVNAAGCGSSMKEYGDLLADDPLWAERARAFSARVRDVMAQQT